MIDHRRIGPVPVDEECAQVGDPDYREKALAECQRFIDLIRKSLGPEPKGAKLGVKWNAHDFGSYIEVVVRYDDQDLEACEYARLVEDETPQSWEG